MPEDCRCGARSWSGWICRARDSDAKSQVSGPGYGFGCRRGASSNAGPCPTAELEEHKLEYIVGARERSSALIRRLVLDDKAPLTPLLAPSGKTTGTTAMAELAAAEPLSWLDINQLNI